MAETVWVVRHGEREDTADPDWADTADRIHDPDLTELGRWQAWRVGRYFADRAVDFDAVYSSPFLRTVHTAEEICTETGHEVRLEPGLGEHRNSEWFDSEPETLPWETLAERFEPVRPDHDPFVYPEFPERHEQALDRTGEAAKQIVAATSGTVLLVGHGLTVGGVVHGLVGSTAAVDAPLCGLTRLERDAGEWHLDFSGTTDHLS